MSNNRLSAMETIELSHKVEPWIDDSIFDGLSDEEADALHDRLYEETGLEFDGVLKKNAPPEICDAYERLRDDALEEARTGLIVD